MMVITRPNKVPFGGYWKYQDKETGVSFAHPVIGALQGQVYNYKLANGKTFDLTEFIQNVCITTGNHICHDAEDKAYTAMEQVAAFTTAMKDWVKSGLEMATPEILAMRIQKCHDCPHWGGTRGSSLLFGRCKICGCRGIKLSLATSNCPKGLW